LSEDKAIEPGENQEAITIIYPASGVGLELSGAATKYNETVWFLKVCIKNTNIV
jgi:hypothetical protein